MSMFVTLHGSETRPLSKSLRARLDGFNSGAPRTVQQANQGTQERLISALWFGHLLPLDRPTRCCWMEATDGFNRTLAWILQLLGRHSGMSYVETSSVTCQCTVAAVVTGQLGGIIYSKRVLAHSIKQKHAAVQLRMLMQQSVHYTPVGPGYFLVFIALVMRAQTQSLHPFMHFSSCCSIFISFRLNTVSSVSLVMAEQCRCSAANSKAEVQHTSVNQALCNKAHTTRSLTAFQIQPFSREFDIKKLNNNQVSLSNQIC